MQTSLPGHDQTTDANPVAIRFAEKALAFPEYAQATAPAEKRASFSGSAFVDPANRLFPITTKGDTLLSGIYAAGLPESKEASAILDKITKAAAKWGIAEDLSQYVGILQSATKSASTEEEFPTHALTIDHEGTLTHYFPIDNVIDIQKSANALIHYLSDHRVPAGWLAKAAGLMKEAAARLEMEDSELPALITRVGTPRELDFEYANVLVQSRKQACAEADVDFSIYTDIIKEASEKGTEESVAEAIQLVEDMDQALGVKYANGMLLPSEIFYCGVLETEFQKFASAHVVISDVLIPATVVGALPDAQINSYWEPEDAEAIRSLTKAARSKDASQASTIAAGFTPELQTEFLKYLVTREG